jgi:hypothetical protein
VSGGTGSQNADVDHSFFVGRSSAPVVRSNEASTHSAWALKGGQLRFELRMREDAATVIEQVWTHDAAPADLGKQLARDLAAAGWRQAVSEASTATPMGHRWSRGRMSLSTVIVPLDRGSGVTAVMRIGK